MIIVRTKDNTYLVERNYFFKINFRGSVIYNFNSINIWPITT